MPVVLALTLCLAGVATQGSSAQTAGQAAAQRPSGGGLFGKIAEADLPGIEGALVDLIKQKLALSKADVANLDALVANIAANDDEESRSLAIASLAARATRDPIAFLQRAAMEWPEAAREQVWGARPFVVLEDFEPVIPPRLFTLRNMQRRSEDSFQLVADAAFRGSQSARLEVGASVRPGITAFGVRLPEIPVPNDPFGIRLHFRDEVPSNAHLILGYVFPNENMSYEYRHTIAADAADGWRSIETGRDFYLIKKRVVESFYEKYLGFLAKLERGTTWKEIPVELHYVALDLPEGDSNTYWLDSLELYLPSEGEAPEVPETAGPLGAATRGFTSRRSFDAAATFPESASAEEMEMLEELNAIGYLGAENEASGNTSVTIYDESRTYDGLNFYITGGTPKAFLMDMAGEVVHTWTFKHDDALFANPAGHYSHWRRAALGQNGDMFAIFEGKALMKMDRNSDVIWANNGNYHHDLELMDDGSIYVLTRIAHVVSRWNTKTPILEDFITVLDSDGNEQRSVSLLECLEFSDYAPLLTNVRSGGDIFHTNTIEVLDGRLADRSPAFKKGNVLVSLNHLDMIGIVDMDQEKFVWTLTGAWQRQHQPTVLDNGHMLIFDNIGPMALKGSVEASRVLEFDPFTREIVWRFEGTRERYFYSHTSGSCARLPNGNTLITETDNGRALEVAPDGTVVWEFWNPARAGENDTLIAKIFELVRLGPDVDVGWLDKDQ